MFENMLTIGISVFLPTYIARTPIAALQAPYFQAGMRIVAALIWVLLGLLGSPLRVRIVHPERSETRTIEACSDSDHCYALQADLEHAFEQGKPVIYVERIYFSNGGYLDFGDATIPGGGVSAQDEEAGRNREWSFGW
jgi:hypothetical protein